jgi:hypothetical protein
MSDVIEPETAIATIETTNFALVFVPGGVEAIVARIEREAREQAEKLDASTAKGRAARRSLGFKVARSKTAIDDGGKALKAEWQAKIAPIDGDRRDARDRLTALRAEIEAPVDEFEAAEEARIAANQNAIAAMEALTDRLADLSTDEIQARAASIQPFDWSVEFRVRAERVRAGVVAQLKVAYGEAAQRETEARAEVARQAEEAERQRLAAIEAQRVREEQIAAEAAERATRDAEERAAREAREAEERAQATLRAQAVAAEQERAAALRREIEAAEALARVEREKAAAEEKAERDRVAAEQKAEADKAAAIEAERQRAIKERQRADYHRSMLQHVKNCGFGFIGPDPQPIGILQYELTEKIKYDEENFGDLLAEALVAKGAALALIQKSVDESNRRHAEEAERQRVAREAAAQKAADEARAADVAHRRWINREAALDLVQRIQLEAPLHLDAGRSFPEALARAVITLIAKGEVRHTRIEY